MPNQVALDALRRVAYNCHVRVQGKGKTRVVTTEVIVRAARRDDEQAIRAMRASAGWSVEYTTRAYAEVQSGRRVMCVAEIDGQAVGTVQLLWDSDDADMADGRNVAHLSDLVVLPAYRRRGIARVLAEHVEQLAASRGYTVITLDVDDTAPATRRLYERWGYVFYRQTISPWGSWLNGMRKPIAARGGAGRAR